MVNLDNVLFAFGPEERYIYNAPSRRARNEVLPNIDELFKRMTIKEVHNAAFGDGNSYFISYWNGSSSQYQWAGVPARLAKWLQGDRANPRISLAAGGSFFAWDRTGFCWQNLLDALEEAIQNWLTEDGWACGKPRWISIGVGGSYIALSSSSSYSYALSVNYPSIVKLFEQWKESLGGIDSVLSNLHSVWLHPYKTDVFAIVGKATGQFWFNNDWDNAINHELAIVGLSIQEPEKAKAMKMEYDKAKQAAKVAELKALEERMKSALEEEKRKKSEEEKRKKAEEEKRKRAEEELRKKAKTKSEREMGKSELV